MSKKIIRIFVGHGMKYEDALAVYRNKIKHEFIENSFSYCFFTGMAEADPIEETEMA